MKEGTQSSILKTTIMAGVIGSAATAMYFLMKNKDTRKKILASVDAAWHKFSELETVDKATKNSPVKKVLDTISSVAGMDDSSNNNKGRKK